MNNNHTITFVQACVVAVIASIATGLIMTTFQKPQAAPIINEVAAASPTGSTFTTSKVALVRATFLISTSTSVLNTDSNNRYIKNLELACTGVGTSQTPYTGAGLLSQGWKISASTSTTAASSAYLNANGNYAFVNYVMSTTSAWLTVSSSTLAIGGFSSTTEWLAGTYLDIFTNATNTAACTVGVSYIPG